MRSLPKAPAPPAAPEAQGRRAFFGAAALLFAASAAGTVAWCLSMEDMGAVPMPGGWTLSMAWMPMCGQTWAGAAASFLGMWTLMMMAMMLPSLVPVLWRYQLALGAHRKPNAALMTGVAGLGYFAVWTLLGALIFAAGAALVQALLRVPLLGGAGPVATGVLVWLAGVFQFTRWKSHHLGCCRRAASPAPARPGAAWRHGVRLGLHCCAACAGWTVLLLALGVMDMGAMALVAAGITAERLLPQGERIARAAGALAMAAGILLTLRASWPA